MTRAGLLLEENRTREVKELTRELPKVFAAKGGHREALAALKVFQEAVERENVTVELIRRVLSFGSGTPSFLAVLLRLDSKRQTRWQTSTAGFRGPNFSADLYGQI